MLTLILLVAAFICFVLAAWSVPPFHPRINYVALGLALWVLTLIIPW